MNDEVVHIRTPGGLLASVADDKKPIVEKWVTAMQEVNTGINDKTLADRKAYREVLVAQIEALREVAGVDEDEPAAAAEADDLPDDFAPVDELSELEPEAGGDLVSQ